MDRIPYELSLLTGKTEAEIIDYSRKTGIPLLRMKEYYDKYGKLPTPDLVATLNA